MAVDKIVKDTMREAIERFAKDNGVDVSAVAFIIHTKKDGNEPSYFYTLSNKTVLTDDGTAVKELTFNDILGVKFDLMARGVIAGNFLANYFRRLEEDGVMPTDEEGKEIEGEEMHKIPAQEVYISIGTQEEGSACKTLYIKILHNTDFIAITTLEEVLGG